MDNASRAMVMSAGVFIAIAVISVAIYFVNLGRGYANASQEMLTTTQIQSFNRFYTAHNSLGQPPKEIKCIDAINILNRAVEDEFLDTNIIINSPASTFITKSGDTYVVAGGHTEFYTNLVKYSFDTNEVGQVDFITIE